MPGFLGVKDPSKNYTKYKWYTFMYDSFFFIL